MQISFLKILPENALKFVSKKMRICVKNFAQLHFLQGVRSGKRVRFHVVHDPDRSCRLHDPLSYSKTDDNTACDPDRSDGHRLVILYAVFQ